MSRCYECCQENCFNLRPKCSCACHDEVPAFVDGEIKYVSKAKAKCDHKGAIMLGYHRTTRVPNRQRGWMYKMSCHCGEQLPITWPLGVAKSNDRPREVKIEIRAAEIAAAPEDKDILDRHEAVGYCHDVAVLAKRTFLGDKSLKLDKAEAGFLARIIEEHK